MKYLFTILFLLTFLGNSFGQTNFRPGYIITNGLDTIIGKIDYRSDVRNMKICSFIREGRTEPTDYEPGRIHGYRFSDDGKFYVSKYLDLEDVQDTVFVEYLLKGITDLYFYRKPLYSTYLLEKEDGEMLELRNDMVEVNRDGQVFMVENNRYLGMLNYAFSDCSNLYNDINNTKLSHKSLINITKKYHNSVCDDELCVIYEKDIPVLSVEILPTIGYSVSILNLKSFEFSNINMEPGYSPYIGLWVNWKLPQINEKWSVLTGVTIREDYYFGHFERHPNEYSDAYYDYHLFSTNVSTSFAFKYTFPRGKVVPIFFAGGTAIFEIEQEFTENQERRVGDRVSVRNIDLGAIYEMGLQPGFIAGAGVEFPFLKHYRLFSNLSVSNVWSGYADKFKVRRTWGAFSVGCIF